MLTPDQCRAARALLDWTILDAAGRSGVSDRAINRFERRQSAPRGASQAALQRAFEVAGVEFGEDGWLRLKARPSRPGEA